MSDDWPPERFQYAPQQKIELTVVDTQAAIDNLCGRAEIGRKVACTKTWPLTTAKVIMPSPCTFKDEEYAKILCHELAHVNGWTGMHEL